MSKESREASTSEKCLPALTTMFSKERQLGLVYLFMCKALTHPENISRLPSQIVGLCFEENPTGEGPEQSALADPALDEGWDKSVSRDPGNLSNPVTLWTFPVQRCNTKLCIICTFKLGNGICTTNISKY